MAPCALAAAGVVQLWAAFTGLGARHHIPAWHWVLLSVALFAFAAVAGARPAYFRVRDFRVAGVAVSALAVLIFVPLPHHVRRYDAQVPSEMVLSIAAGVAAMALVFAVAPPISRTYRPDHAREARLPVAIIVVAALLLPVWLRTVGTTPLAQLFAGGASGIDLAIARHDALSGLGSAPLRLLVGSVRNLYLMFAVGWFTAYVLSTPRAEWRRRSRRWWALSFVLGIAAAFALVTTERAIVGQVAIAAVIAGMVVTRRVLTVGGVIALGAASLAFPIFFGYALAGGGWTAIESALRSISRRLFFVPDDVLVQYFVSFPGRRPHLYGESIPKIQALFGRSTFDLSGYIYEVGYRFDDRFTGSANGSFLGVGWANFGAAGVVVWAAVAAGVMILMEQVLAGLPRRTSAALRGVVCIQAVLLTSADITRTLLSVAPGLLDLVVVVVVVEWLERRLVSRDLPVDRPLHAAPSSPAR